MAVQQRRNKKSLSSGACQNKSKMNNANPNKPDENPNEMLGEPQ
jgi:hypothetical protein